MVGSYHPGVSHTATADSSSFHFSFSSFNFSPECAYVLASLSRTGYVVNASGKLPSHAFDTFAASASKSMSFSVREVTTTFHYGSLPGYPHGFDPRKVGYEVMAVRMLWVPTDQCGSSAATVLSISSFTPFVGSTVPSVAAV